MTRIMTFMNSLSALYLYSVPFYVTEYIEYSLRYSYSNIIKILYPRSYRN